MNEFVRSLLEVLTKHDLITAFATVGILVWIAYQISDRLTQGRLHGSAIAILIGLVLAYASGVMTGGKKGVADFTLLAGVGLMGGAMLRDFAIISTAFGINVSEMKRAGLSGAIALLLGIVLSFFTGATIAFAFGYTDAVSMTTIGGGAATYIVGPVTGAAIGARSDVIALSIAAGLVKAILVMVCTPWIAKGIGLDNPRTAMIFGGLMGTTSGVAGGLAATDPALVPYGAMTATFYTGIGCLMGPSVIFVFIRFLVG